MALFIYQFIVYRILFSTLLMAEKHQEAETFHEVKNHLLKYGKAEQSKAWQAIGLSLLYIIIGAGITMSGMPLLGWALQSFTIVRIFVQFHDMAHYSFFSSPSLNRIIGTVFGIYVHFPFDAWRIGHNHHHRHFGNIDRFDLSQTILFTKKQYNQMPTVKRTLVRIFREPIVFFFITEPFVWFFGLIFVIIKKYGVFNHIFVQKILSLVFVFVLCPLLGISSLRMFLATYVTNLIGTTLFHLQHSVNQPYRERKQKWDFVRAALEGSTFLHIPNWFKSFTNGIEYHHIHHLNTNVPSYKISECHYKFGKEEKKNWDDYSINRVDYWLAFKSMFNVMLDEDNKELVPFSYKFW